MVFQGFLDRLAVPEDVRPGTPGWEWVGGEDIPAQLRAYYLSKTTPIVAVQLGYSVATATVWYMGIIQGPHVVIGSYSPFTDVFEMVRYDTTSNATWFGFFTDDPIEARFGQHSGTLGQFTARVMANAHLDIEGYAFIDRFAGGGSPVRKTLTGSNNGVSGIGAVAGENVTSASFVNIAVGTGTSFTLEKQYPSTHTRVRLRMYATAWCQTAFDTVLEWGVRCNGVDTAVDRFYYNQISRHEKSCAGEVYLPALNAGDHVIQARWRRVSGAGTPRRDDADMIHMYAEEVSI